MFRKQSKFPEHHVLSFLTLECIEERENFKIILNLVVRKFSFVSYILYSFQYYIYAWIKWPTNKAIATNCTFTLCLSLSPSPSVSFSYRISKQWQKSLWPEYFVTVLQVFWQHLSSPKKMSQNWSRWNKTEPFEFKLE